MKAVLATLALVALGTTAAIAATTPRELADAQRHGAAAAGKAATGTLNSDYATMISANVDEYRIGREIILAGGGAAIDPDNKRGERQKTGERQGRD